MKNHEYNPLIDGLSIEVPKGWAAWDIINIKGPMTCQEFVDFFDKVSNVKILGIACNFKSIPFKIEDIYQKVNNLKKDQNSLWLEISGLINNISLVMPKIKYIFNQIVINNY